MKSDDVVYVDTPVGLVPVASIWGACSRCGEHVPITSLRPPLGSEDDENPPLLCHECFLAVCEEQLEELVSHCGWTKRFEDGQWYYYPPEEVGE